jgi:hypothetical protein
MKHSKSQWKYPHRAVRSFDIGSVNHFHSIKHYTSSGYLDSKRGRNNMAAYRKSYTLFHQPGNRASIDIVQHRLKKPP